MDKPLIHELLQQARADAPSVTALAADLIRLPSRGGIDDYEPVLAAIEDWLTPRALRHRRLHCPDGKAVALLIEVTGDRPGPVWVLDACLDTAPFGDESAWSFPPTAGDISNGLLRGRGAADSKTGAAMFCHIAAALSRRTGQLAGTLAVLLDVDEHTGNFGGAKALMEAIDPATIAGAMIGYPGHDEVVIGGRGVFRARLHVHGTSGHSGSSKPNTANAVSRAARLVTTLEDMPLPAPVTGGFPLPPKLTVTEIHSGEGFTAVPDHAVVGVDVRLTDGLDAKAAEELIRKAAVQLDADFPAPRATEIEAVLAWPPYQLAPTDQPAAALLAGAEAAGIPARPKVAGPSNIGNLLATRQIRTTAGFGLPYTGLHGTDEHVALSALPAVQAAYHHAVLSLLTARTGQRGR
ncbi:M20 family metallopeptidase [Streptomyces sp. NPDC050161]|uniref:M20 family metallopeptidase n=1 Tax=Streptomyces sp. NPDC050161 TaxID=3365604 RepID=UPI0037A394ED